MQHGHDFAEIFWVVRSEGAERRLDAERLLSVGDVGIADRDVIHGFDGREDFTLCNVAFPTRLLTTLRRRYSDWPEVNGDTRTTLDVDALEQLWRVAEPMRAGRRDLLTFDRFMLTLVGLLAPMPTASPLPGWLRSALSGDLLRRGVPDFVDACGYSHEHVARTCKALLGKSPTDLVTDARLDHAARLLADPDVRVTDACLQSGFANLGHFHARFKRRFGTTPRRYKAKQLGVNPVHR